MGRLALVLFLLVALGASGQEAKTVDVPDEEAVTASPRLNIKGFGDVNFRWSRDDDSQQNRNTFTVGQVDLFITSPLTDRIAVLAEVVGKFRRTNETVFDVERIHITYALSDLANIRAGRMHTPLGYWNETYHHGTWFQTTAGRPDVYAFNDVGGVLPIHSVGVELFGSKSLPALDVAYNLSVMNGRGRVVTETQNVQDFNRLKAVNLLVHLSPSALPGLRLGGDLYLDKIPTTDARRNELNETIVGAHAVYLSGAVELLAEYLNVAHRDEVANVGYRTQGAYVQVAYRLDRVKPYYRFDYQSQAAGDPYFLPVDLRTRRHTVGLRWDVLVWNGVKLEGSFLNRDGVTETSVTLQTAFTF